MSQYNETFFYHISEDLQDTKLVLKGRYVIDSHSVLCFNERIICACLSLLEFVMQVS